MNNLDIILISDKLELTTDFISSLKMRGGKIVNSILDINEDMLNDNHNICILESFLDDSMNKTMLTVYQELFDFNLYYIGSDVESNVYLKSIACCYNCSIDNLSIALIENILADDSVAIEHNILSDGILEDTVNDYATEILSQYLEKDAEYKVAEAYLTLVSSTNLLSELKDFYKDKYKLLENKVEGKDRMTLNCIKEYNNLIDNINKTNSALQEYEDILNKDIYEIIDVTTYENRPFIIYIKQYQEITHQDSFIVTLRNIIKEQLRSSVKVLKLYDYNDTIEINNLAEIYKLIKKEYKLSDFESYDFIAKVGNYERILERLLKNVGNLDYLIIVDCKIANKQVITGADLSLAFCRNKDNLQKHNLYDSYTITSNGIDKYKWTHYKEVEDIADDTEKFMFLSSRPVIKNILKSIEIQGAGA